MYKRQTLIVHRKRLLSGLHDRSFAPHSGFPVCWPQLQRNHRENWLALCPICAAKYRHANASTPEEIRRLLFSAEDQEILEILVRLARKSETIQFTAKHMLDIVTELKTDAAEIPPPDSLASPPMKSGG